MDISIWSQNIIFEVGSWSYTPKERNIKILLKIYVHYAKLPLVNSAEQDFRPDFELGPEFEKMRPHFPFLLHSVACQTRA